MSRDSIKMVAMLTMLINHIANVFLPAGQVWEAVGCAVPILVSAFVILYLYNGRRAARGRTFYKWFFYAFYPSHLLPGCMIFAAPGLDARTACVL